VTIAVIVLALVILVLGLTLGWLALADRRSRQAQPPESGTSLAIIEPPVESSNALVASSNALIHDIGVDGSALDSHGLHVQFASRELATIRWTSDPPPDGPNLVVAGVIQEIGRYVPELAEKLQKSGTYLVTFSRATTQALQKGDAVLQKGGQVVARDVPTGQFMEIGAVAAGAGVAGVAWPVVLAGGVAVAAAAYSQWQLQKALEKIDSRLRGIQLSLFLDDVGVLMGSQALARDLIEAAQAGNIPHQLASELAVARREVDRVYFGKVQRLERFLSDVKNAQEAARRESADNEVTWAKNVVDSFGDLVEFENEILLFLRAMTCRAHLAAATAAVISYESDPSIAFDLLDRTESDLRTTLNEFDRHLSALVDHPPTGILPGPKKAHLCLGRIRSVLDDEIRLLLPLEAQDDIPVSITVESVIDVAEDQTSMLGE
jgi:hypothetical protein